MRRLWKGVALVALALSASAWSECGCDPKYYPKAPRGPAGELTVRAFGPDGDALSPSPLVYVLFGGSIVASSVGPAALIVLDDGVPIGGPAEPTYHADGSCIGVSCTPTQVLRVGTVYTAIVSTEIRSAFGPYGLEEEFRWTFQVNPESFHTWQEPEVLDSEEHAGAAILPVVVTQDVPDNATAVWVERAVQDDFSYRNALRSRTWLSYSSVGLPRGVWSSSAHTHVSDSRVDGVLHADCNPDGDGVVAFPVQLGATGSYTLWLGRFEYRVGGPTAADWIEWLLPVERGDSIIPIETPQVGIDPLDHSVAVFVMQTTADMTPSLYAVRTHLTNLIWGEPALVDAVGGGSVAEPYLAHNALGEAFAVWTVRDHATRYHLRGGRYDKLAPDTGWTWVGALDDTPFDGRARSLSAGLDQDNNATVVWARADVATSAVWALRFDGAAAAPTAPVELSAGLGGTSQAPHVAVHPDGRAVAVWVHVSAPLDESLVAMRYVPGEGWRDRTVVWSGTRCEEPYVAMGAGGDAIVVWHHGGEVVANHHLGTTNWSDGVVLSRFIGTSDLVARPRVVIDHLGRATAIWQQMDYRWRVAAARYETPP